MYCHEVLSTVLMLVVFDLVLGLSVTYDLGKNCDANLTMKCHFSGAFDATNTRYWLHPTVSDPILDKGAPTGSSGRYTEDITTSASSFFTMTIKEVTLADAGTYFCQYDFENAANVTLTYECYGDTVGVDIKGTCSSSNKAVITVDHVYPDTATLTVALSTSPNSAIAGDVASEPSTVYPNHFKLTWTSDDTVSDGTHTYTVAIQTNAAGTLVTIADNLSVTCGGDDGLKVWVIIVIVICSCGGGGVICVVTFVGVKQYKKSKKGTRKENNAGNRVSPDSILKKELP